VLGILPGIIGVIQATETVKIILGKGSTLSGRLLLYDALNMRFRELKLQPDPQALPITELVDYEWFCGMKSDQDQQEDDVGEPFQRMSVAEIKQRMDEGWTPYVLDVRRAHEADIVSLSFVDRLQPHDQVASIADALPRERDIVVHCKMGGRSARAAQTLASLGFSRVINMEGGITAWAREIEPSLPVY
jgi:adenylyltransferase/sulfurtransferase